MRKRSWIFSFLFLLMILYSNKIIGQSYAPLPFYESFEKAWVNKNATRDVPSLYWTNTPATTDLSWSRNDDGYARGAWSDNSSSTNTSYHYACFHSSKATLGKSGVLDVKVNFSGYSDAKTLTFMYVNINGVDTLSVYLSTNGGVTFGSYLKKLYTASGWTKITVPLGTSTSSNCVVRFAATSDLSSDICIDEVIISTPTTPITANFGVNKTSGTVPFTVQFSDSSSLDATSWSWDFNNDGVVDATTRNPKYTYSSGGLYTVKLTCKKGSLSQTMTKTDYINVASQLYTTLPFYEDFENDWINRDSIKDVPSLYFRNLKLKGDSSWHRDDDVFSWSSANGFYVPRGANGSAHSMRFPSYNTRGFGIMDLFVDFSSQTGDKELRFKYLNTSGSDNLQVFLSTDGGVTFGTALTTLNNAPEWNKIIVNLGNVNSNHGVLRFKAVGDNGYSDIGIDQIYIESPSATPVVADFVYDKTGGMAPLTIHFADISTGAPSLWNWDFNNDGIADSTSKNPSFIYNTPGIYAVSMVASKAGSKDTIKKDSAVVVAGYASLPLFEDFERPWVSLEKNRDVPSWYVKNTPAFGYNSWSRDDDGLKRGAWTYQSYSMGGANESSHCAQFHSSRTTGKGDLDFYIDFSTLAGSKSLVFWYRNNSGNDSLKVYLSVNGGVTFGNPINAQGELYYWTKVIVDLGDITSTTGIVRFEAIGDNNTSDIGIDDVSVVSSDVIAIDAKFTADVIAGIAPLTVNFSDQSIGVPTSWAWDFNNDGIIDANTKNPSYNFTTPGLYAVTLTASKANSSNSITKTSYIDVERCASLPFLERFEGTWINRNDIRDVPSIYVKNSPATGNNSWSRNDDGEDRDAWDNMYGSYIPAGADSSLHSARFHSYYSSNGYLDFFIDFSSLSGNKTLSFSHINKIGTDTLKVFLSIDGGKNFSQVDFETINTKWKKVNINLGNVTSSKGVIRFKGSRSIDESDIGIDEVAIGTGTLVDAMFSANQTKGTAPFTVNFTDKSTGLPTSWKWDFNNDGITDATTPNPTFTYTHSGLYTVKLTVSKTGSYDEVELASYIWVKGYAVLPFSENFEGVWLNNNDIRDIPGLNVANSPATGNNSWSRNDDGVARGAWTDQNGAYSYPGANSSMHSARFHSYSSSKGKYGTLDFNIDFSSQSGNKMLSFSYVNVNGTDSLQVLLSTDGGLTFGSSLKTLKISSAWANYSIDLGNLTATQGVIRFKAFSDYAYTDIGIDEISISTIVDAQFTANKFSGTAPLTVSFTDQSTGSPTSWSWDFNNDGIVDATTQNPTYTYSTPGFFTVKLTVSKPGSIDELKQVNYVSVENYAQLPFSENFENVWINSRGTRDVPNLNAISKPTTGNNSWSRNDDGVARGAWSVESGAYSSFGAKSTMHSARFHSYAAPKDSIGILDFDIDFSSKTGGKALSFSYLNIDGADSMQVLLSTDGGLTFGQPLKTLKGNSSWTDYTINIGTVATSKGVIRFMAFSDYGFTDIGLDEILVSTIVDAQFVADKTNGITPLTVSFTDQSTGSPTAWSWDLNNDGTADATTQNPSFTYAVAGSYTVKLTASKTGSTDTETKTAYIVVSAPDAPVEAQFVADKTRGTSPLTVYFTDQSTGSPTAWSWDFNNDGTVEATTQNPSFTYAVAGSYTVKLTASKTGSTDTETKTAYIVVSAPDAPVEAQFVADKTRGTSPLTVSFTDQSTGSPTAWSWDFNNDGTVEATTQTPTFTYSAAGSYTVKLTASKTGSTDTETKTAYIVVSAPDAPVEAQFVADKTNGITPLTVSFTDQSTGSPTAWSWDLNNDGTADATTQNPSFTYAVAGSYTVKLTASKTGSTDTETKTAYIVVSAPDAPVEAQFVADKTRGTSPLTVYFTDQSTGSPTAWSWDFNNDGTVEATTQTPTFTYSAAGSYTVKLTASKTGSTDTETKTAYIVVSAPDAPVEAQFVADKTRGTSPLTVSFTDQSTGSPTAWSWDFNNDGTVEATTQTPTFTYSAAGSYTVKLTASKTGSTDTETKTAYIVVSAPDAPVEAQFVADKTRGTSPLTVSFTDQSTGSPTAWSWDFNNDGTVDATTQNPSYTYAVAGSYTVKLTASKTGSTDTETKTAYIVVSAPDAPVEAQFVADKTRGTSPLTVSFTDQSTGSPTAWSWDFNNDGTVDATTQNPSYTYATAGSYTVKLTASKTGSTDTVIRTGYIVVDRATEIQRTEVLDMFEVYPNPASEIVNIHLSEEINKDNVRLVIIDNNGTIVNTVQLFNQSLYQLDLNKYPKGLYFINVITNNQVFKKKLIVM